MDELKKQEKEKSKVREWAEFVLVIIVGMALALFIRFNVAQVFFIKGESMLPTFQNGDIALATLYSYRDEMPKIGEIVVVEAESLDNKKIIKRVVGTEGDTIAIQTGVLYRNGKEVKETYIKEEIENDFEEIVVPKDHIFVMGDNRNASTDSRYIGPIENEDIIGKVVFEFWNNPFSTY